MSPAPQRENEVSRVRFPREGAREPWKDTGGLKRENAVMEIDTTRSAEHTQQECSQHQSMSRKFVQFKASAMLVVLKTNTFTSLQSWFMKSGRNNNTRN